MFFHVCIDCLRLRHQRIFCFGICSVLCGSIYICICRILSGRLLFFGSAIVLCFPIGCMRCRIVFQCFLGDSIFDNLIQCQRSAEKQPGSFVVIILRRIQPVFMLHLDHTIRLYLYLRIISKNLSHLHQAISQKEADPENHQKDLLHSLCTLSFFCLFSDQPEQFDQPVQREHCPPKEKNEKGDIHNPVSVMIPP